MHTNFMLTVIAGLLLAFGLAVPAAQAQGPCTLQTIAGTYVISEKGSSAILDPNSAPYPLHWAGALAPFVAIGEVTFGNDGIGRGFYWIRIGSFNGGLDPTPVEVTITEINADCTGRWRFPFNLLGNTYTIEERFVAFDNGRETRSVPTVTGVPTLTWIGESHRISKPSELLNTCGPQTGYGSYLMAVESLVRFDPANPIFSDALLLRLDISMSGDYTGRLYEKLGPTGNIVLPVSGKLTVNPDCSYATDLIIDFGGGVTAAAPVRGVFFDQGKKMFGLNMNNGPLGTQFSYGEGVRIGQ
jgi:hypothetical protein